MYIVILYTTTPKLFSVVAYEINVLLGFSETGKIDSRMKLYLYSTTLIIFECSTIRISVVNWVASLN